MTEFWIKIETLVRKLDVAVKSLQMIKEMTTPGSELAGKTLEEMEKIDNEYEE